MGRKYVNWSWLASMATLMWVGLILNDWKDNELETEIYFKTQKVPTENLSFKETFIRTQADVRVRPNTLLKITSPEPFKPVLKTNDTSSQTISKNVSELQEVLKVNESTPVVKKNEIKTQPVVVNISEPMNRSSEDVIPKNPYQRKTISSGKLIWNLVVFTLSVLICIVIRSVLNRIVNLFIKRKTHCKKSSTVQNTIYNHLRSKSQLQLTSRFKTSKIPKIQRSLSEVHLIPPTQDTTIFKELSQYKNKLSQEEQKVLQLQEDIETFQKDHIREQNNLNRTLDTVTKQKYELARQLSQVIRESKLFKMELEEIVKTKVEIEQKLHNLKEDFKKSIKEKTKMKKHQVLIETENEHLKKALDMCRNDILKHEQKIMQLEKEIIFLKSRLNSLRSRKSISRYEKPKENSSTSSVDSPVRRNRSNIPVKVDSIPKSLRESSNELITEVTSKENLYSDIQTRLRNLEENIVLWEGDGEGQLSNLNTPRPQAENAQISEIFHTCCDNSNEESSDYGITSESYFRKVYRHEHSSILENTNSELLESSPATTVSHTDATITDNGTSTGNSDNSTTTESIDDDFDTRFEPSTPNLEYHEELDHIMASLEQQESNPMTRKQTLFLQKYFQADLNEHFDSLTNFVGSNSYSITKPIGDSTPAGCTLYTDEENKFPNSSLALQHLFATFDSWNSTGGSQASTTMFKDHSGSGDLSSLD